MCEAKEYENHVLGGFDVYLIFPFLYPAMLSSWGLFLFKLKMHVFFLVCDLNSVINPIRMIGFGAWIIWSSQKWMVLIFFDKKPWKLCPSFCEVADGRIIGCRTIFAWKFSKNLHHFFLYFVACLDDWSPVILLLRLRFLMFGWDFMRMEVCILNPEENCKGF